MFLCLLFTFYYSVFISSFDYYVLEFKEVCPIILPAHSSRFWKYWVTLAVQMLVTWPPHKVTLLLYKDTMHNMTHLVKNKFTTVFVKCFFFKREMPSAISSLSFSCLITSDLSLSLCVYKHNAGRLFPAVSRIYCLAPPRWCLQPLDSAFSVTALSEFNREWITYERTHNTHVSGLASHNGLGCWSVPVFNQAQKPVLCLAVIEGAGACSSLITLYAVMESFTVDLMHKCFTRCFVTLQCIVMIPLRAKSDIFLIQNSDIVLDMFNPKDRPKPYVALEVTRIYRYDHVGITLYWCLISFQKH